ncbi:hypothetical protein GU926_08380 [Nibribacter ruber]|uniref:Uncharacterized protein n=1 Tax=Nibribacter ruber TaxID=2698458 RepID=A0A6P1P1C9_9BACT|nr:hypothetical protein [Nibribacter ruber]QHL87453.1 hypothetical protein GU926_08380 [Nibribacter ruber]
MCTSRQTSVPSVIMIANQVGDNHQSVELVCGSCEETRILMLEQSYIIQRTLAHIQSLLLGKAGLNQLSNQNPCETTNED